MMRRCLLIAAFVCAVAMAAAAQERMAPPAGSGAFQISGIVVNASNDQPLAGAYVTITAVQGAAARTVLTGADGAFRFHGVRPGKYQLSAERRGFASQQYQQHEGFSTAIAVGAALDSGNIVFRALPDASFSGRIADEQGDAVRTARVMLVREQAAEGRAIKAIVANASTDDQGRYHFAHLKPGAYYLVVSARPWFTLGMERFGPRFQGGGENGPANARPNPALDVAYPLTFYPDVTDSSAARPIRLQAGDRASADITLHAVPALHVRINNAAGEQKREELRQFANATLVQTMFEDIEVPMQGMTRIIGGNASMISGVAPGHYLLRVTPNAHRFQRPAPPPNEESEQPSRAREVDLVADTELDASEMAPTATVSGTVKLPNGQTKPPTIGLRRGAMRRTFDARVNAGGEFAFPEGFAAGTYEVVMNSGDGLFIRSVTASGAKIAGRMLRISGSDPVKLSIVVSAGTGKIEGIALRDEKPQSGALILLVPQDPENNLPLFRRDQSDSDGSFTLSPVLPGRYSLLALENGWDLHWADAAVLKPFLANGATIVVEAQGNYQVRVKVQ